MTNFPSIFQLFFVFQVQKICRKLLENCAKSQYASGTDSMSSPSCSSFSSHPETNTSDSDTSENGTSLLHQALKRKRTDSETEQLFKRQFFLTTAPPNYFSPNVSSVSQSSTSKPIFKTTSSVLTSSPKFISRPLQSPSGSILTQSNATSRPIFHIIQANPNRNLKLSTLRNSHVELCQLLQQNKNPSATSTSDNSIPTIKEEPKN